MTTPKYLQIAELYSRLIDNGEICRGEKIPAIKDIARKHGVAQATAAKVTEHLRREGYVHTNSQGAVVTKGNYRPKPEPALREDLSLHEGLVEFLDRCGWDAARLVQSVLDEHAHRLAEKQRAKLIFDGYGPVDKDDDGFCPCGSCSWCLAQDYIDLIDPKAQT